MGKKRNDVPENLEVPMITEVETVEVSMITEVETVEVPQEITDEPEEYQVGKVTGCDKLNVRVAPNAAATVAKTIKKGTEVMVVVNESTDDFYKICTESGLEGFCMKQFVAIQG